MEVSGQLHVPAALHPQETGSGSQHKRTLIAPWVCRDDMEENRFMPAGNQTLTPQSTILQPSHRTVCSLLSTNGYSKHNNELHDKRCYNTDRDY
jgi:hypothetical protein